MNILASHVSPYNSAIYLDDTRVLLSMTQTTIILRTALRLNRHSKGKLSIPLKDLDALGNLILANHPCNQWGRASRVNYKWLIEFLENLFMVHEQSIKGVGFKYIKEQIETYKYYSDYIIDKPQTEFVNSTYNKFVGANFTHIKDVNQAYRFFLKRLWETDKIRPIWTGRVDPRILKVCR